MSDVTVAIVNQYEKFNGVVLRHIQETEINNVVGFVFHKDHDSNRFMTVAFSDDSEKVYSIDDLAYIAIDELETDETETDTEKPEKYTVDEIERYIHENYESGEIKYSYIFDGAIYSILSGRFPHASMALCFDAVMKVWKEILDSDDKRIYDTRNFANHKEDK